MPHPMVEEEYFGGQLQFLVKSENCDAARRKQSDDFFKAGKGWESSPEAFFSELREQGSGGSHDRAVNVVGEMRHR